MKSFKHHTQKTTKTIHENPILNRVYQNRGIKSPNELDHALTNLLSPFLMKDMEKAVNLLVKHIDAGSHIMIISDYDCDGATACAIAVEGLAMLGCENISFLVPDRFEHGYGLQPSIVELASKSNPDLIITVDNGISSVEGALAVRSLEHPCELLITDHHLAPTTGLPEAEAIVNPNQPGCEFPSKAIAGVGVMFYVITALRTKLRELGRFESQTEPRIGSLLDIVALGTVADVVALDQNNRIMVNAGLSIINKGYARPGINALLTVAKKEIGKIVASDFGFGAGPRLNAAGRLEDMKMGIQCLLSKNTEEACAIAKTLDDLNVKRREIESEMVTEALDKLNNLETDRFGVCLYRADWHEGVVGIVSSRIKDKLNRPVICFTDSNNGEIKGSARSVPGVHIRDVLDAVATQNPGLLTKFGGHAAAAGLSFLKSDFELFQKAFDEEVKKHLSAEMIRGVVETDMTLPPELINLESAELIRGNGPWGQLFEEPVFDGEFDIVDLRVLKEKHLKLIIKDQTTNQTYEAISFNCIEDGELPVRTKIRCAYTLDINEFRNNRKLQLMIKYMVDEEVEKDKKKMANSTPEDINKSEGYGLLKNYSSNNN